ncbi:MAG: ATP-binding protein [Bacteroidetes bacterium]|nr:ATP-binding protein [Bacteroidota bacterium]
MSNLKKIVILGPESTGKSSLCAALASHFQTIWCPEFARAYLLEHGTDYRFEDLLTIAKGQLAQEDAYTAKLLESNAATPNYLFIDTDMYVMKVWCEFVFGKCHTWILDQITERKYDLYLLCKPDLPWVKDELREYPDEATRIKLYHHYRDLLIHQSTPWAEVSGTNEDRLNCALRAVEQYLS